MKTLGFDNPLYILPFDHRGSFETKMFGWHGDLNAAQTAEIAAAKQVIYDGFKAAIAVGVPKKKAGILVDEQFGSAILRDAWANDYTIACPAEKSRQDDFWTSQPASKQANSVIATQLIQPLSVVFLLAMMASIGVKVTSRKSDRLSDTLVLF